jgi:YjjI family glycine radical enzyme
MILIDLNLPCKVRIHEEMLNMGDVFSILKDPLLTYEQKVLTLARAAEDSVDVLDLSPGIQSLRARDILCDLFEGHAPYRPRYIVVDFEKFMKQGSTFLEIDPPSDLEEAIHALLILYKHIPSISSFPVYIGNLDTLLEPFVEDEERAFKSIKLFLKHIDRTITDSFCHGNLGPAATRAGALILRAERALQDAIPNLTLRVSDQTDEGFLRDAALTSLITAKPSFANHAMFDSEFSDFKDGYAIVSCYNGLPIGGGSYTLTRLKLDKLAFEAHSIDDYLGHHLPAAVGLAMAYMDERIRFLVEESNFFESNFLVREGLIHKDRFTAMLGEVGLAEAVNHLMKLEGQEGRFGHSIEADDLGIQIIETLQKVTQSHFNPHLATNGHYLLHAQVGIDSDSGTSPGCRIPIGDEPPIHDHLLQAARFHKYFPSGIGDIFSFDETVKNNPQVVVDIVKGAFDAGMRYFSSYASDADVIRITGYLVKRSEIDKLRRGEAVLQDTVALGKGAVDHQHILERRVRFRDGL